MKKEMDFKIWVQEYEEEAKKITERIAELKECLKSCSKSERENLQCRISFQKGILRENRSIVDFLRKRDREERT